MFLDALYSLAVSFTDIIKACEEAEMPDQLIADLDELKDGKKLFSELKPAQYHRLGKHLIGDPMVCIPDISVPIRERSIFKVIWDREICNETTSYFGPSVGRGHRLF